jgi:predicted NACHT family NTPase
MAAEFVTQNIERFYNTGKDVIKGAADKFRLHLNSSYKDYLACVAERHSKGKSFFIRHDPTTLYDFYVPIGVSNEKNKIPHASISGIAAVNRFAVITGGGGSGKSMLMRHLLLDAIKHKQKVPVLLELRELNEDGQSLLDFIKDTLRSNRFSLDDDYIEKALKAGHFALLLDGLDEVALSSRKTVIKQLFQLVKNYDQNIILLSSRPEPEFSGWPAFSVFNVDALTLEQAVELVSKLPFDDDLKAKFLRDLQDRLFAKHNSFLSNPLLLSIMLLTYGESADIPDKLSLFYSQAYETLFHRHDALKAGFQRDRLTKLNIQDFARVFSAFSIQTFDRRQF